VDAKCTSRCRTAVQQLPAMDSAFLESDDDIHSQPITHLVIGQDRRTIKALLAACSGAQLLQPAWLSDSLAARVWLNPSHYQAQVLIFSRLSSCLRCISRRAKSVVFIL
jgi:hypothetical protein